jgi:transposase-like protein
MEHIREILQLYKDGVPIREIARRVGVSRNSVRKYLQRIGTSTDGIENSKAFANAA